MIRNKLKLSYEHRYQIIDHNSHSFRAKKFALMIFDLENPKFNMKEKDD